MPFARRVWLGFFKPDNNSDGFAFHRKATIVLEHLIQASDVAHTMQHWYVFVKWNERLFDKMYKAYLDGRADIDPSVSWYKDEMGFFKYYVILLAKKMESCGVFGVSSAEYLDYAETNSREWELMGQEVIAGYLHKYNTEYGTTLLEGSPGKKEGVGRRLSMS